MVVKAFQSAGRVFRLPPGNSHRRHLLILVLMALLSGLIYFFLLVWPTSILEYYDQPRLDTLYFVRNRPYNQVRLLLAYLSLGGLYVWGWRAARQAQGRLAWGIVLVGALVCGFLLLFLYPFDAADIFDNIMHGRILGIYGENPFIVTGVQFPKDPFYSYMAWKKFPSAYGPLWELLAGGVARLAGDDIVANVFVFKLLPGIFWLLSLVVVALYLRSTAPGQALAGVFLLAWNPVVLFETWGNGHNDMTMVFWILLGAWLIMRRRYLLAILALLAGALSKFVPVLLLPAAGLIALRDIHGFWPRAKFLLSAVAAGLLLLWIAYQPFWIGLETLNIQRRANLFTTSLPAVAHNWLYIIDQRAAEWVSPVALGLTVVFVAWRSWRALRDRCTGNFVEAAFDILAFYLLVTCLWFQQWYTLWLVGIAASLAYGWRQRFAAFFSLSAIGKQLWIGPMLFTPRAAYPQPELEIRFVLGVLGLPWMYLVAIWFSSMRFHRDVIMGETMKNEQRLNALLVVAKRPAAGQTKTRLTPPLSPEMAAALYECFLRDTLDLARGLPGVQPGLAYLPAGDEAYFQGLAPDFERIVQAGNDLGERLDHATSHFLGRGYRYVVVMDSDSPTLPRDYLAQAFQALETGWDVVLGPCEDGGYYLIGFTQPQPRLLREVQMSTPYVTQQTLALAEEQGLGAYLLPTWYDVDDGGSLARLAAELDSEQDELTRHTRKFLAGCSLFWRKV